MKPLIYLTGCDGFVGRALCTRLTDAGYVVVGIDSRWGKDICDVDIYSGIPPESVVIHLAAISTNAACNEDPLTAMEVNIGGTLRLAKAAKHACVRQFIFASSEWVYANCGRDTLYETAYLDPSTMGVYAFTKLTGERILTASGIENVMNLRFGIISGPGAKSVVETLSSGTIGSRATGRRFVHIEDLCDGILKSIDKAGVWTVNLTGNRFVTLGEIAARRGLTVAESCPWHPDIRDVGNRLAKDLLDWNPTREVLS